MDDTYTSPGPYGLRLCRAAGLVLIGAAIHILLPEGASIRIPMISPLEIVQADAWQPRKRALLVERTTVFAPLVGGFREALAPNAPDEPVGTTGSVNLRASSNTGSDSTAGVPPAAARVGDDAPDLTDRDGPLPVVGLADTPDAPDSAAPRTAAALTPPVGNAADAPPVLAAVAPLAEPPAAAERIEPLPTSVHAAAVNSASEEVLVRRLLDEYAGAFERLDVRATQAVWPSVNGKALERAYGQLASQRLTLQGCGITISGSTANARCQGSATYQPRIGKRPVVDSREWTFHLSKKDAAWRIVALR